MAEVGAAAGVDDFIAAAVGVGADDDGRGVDRLHKARPTGAAVELVVAREQRLAGREADIRAGGVVVVIGVVIRRFSALLEHDVVLLGREASLVGGELIGGGLGGGSAACAGGGGLRAAGDGGDRDESERV